MTNAENTTSWGFRGNVDGYSMQMEGAQNVGWP